MKCCVLSCKNYSDKRSDATIGITFHLIPCNDNVKKQWISKINRKNWTPTKYTKICSSHFNADDFKVTSKGLRKLKKGTLPCLNLDLCVQKNEEVATGSHSYNQNVDMHNMKQTTDNSTNVSVQIEAQEGDNIRSDFSSTMKHADITPVNFAYDNPENILIKIENPEPESEDFQNDSFNSQVGMADMNNTQDNLKHFALEIKIRRLIIEKRIIQKKNKVLTQQNNSLKKKMANMKSALIMLKKKNHQLQRQIAKKNSE